MVDLVGRSMAVCGEISWPSVGTFGGRPWGVSVAVYGEFCVSAVTCAQLEDRLQPDATGYHRRCHLDGHIPQRTAEPKCGLLELRFALRVILVLCGQRESCNQAVD